MSLADLSVRKMAKALGVTKSQVGRDKQAGMQMASVEAARAWRLATHDISRTVDGRIDRVQTPAGTIADGQLPAARRLDTDDQVYTAGWR